MQRQRASAPRGHCTGLGWVMANPSLLDEFRRSLVKDGVAVTLYRILRYPYIRWQRSQTQRGSAEERFTKIYQMDYWRSRESRSGRGFGADPHGEPAMAPAIARFAMGAVCLLARLSQHRARQHQDRTCQRLPLNQQKACAGLPRQLRLALRPSLSARHHDRATDV